MANGQGGVPSVPSAPGLPQFDMSKIQNISTDVSQKNIFDLIKQSFSQSMTSVLPYVQNQFTEQSKAAEPQYAAIRKAGETNIASAQSDAGARGMRGSDIEAAGMVGARNATEANITQLRSQLAMAQAQSMAEQIMKAYGYDLEANASLMNNLAQAIGQKMARDQEAEIAAANARALARANKNKDKNSLFSSLIQAGGAVATGGISAAITAGAK